MYTTTALLALSLSACTTLPASTTPGEEPQATQVLSGLTLIGPDGASGQPMDLVLAEGRISEIVPTGSLDPDCIHLPGVYVQRMIVGAPYDKKIEFETTRERESA